MIAQIYPTSTCAIESPYKPTDGRTLEDNIEYARKCMKHAMSLGYAPFASHLLYTQVLDDTITEERNLGIDMGMALSRKLDTTLFYVDNGVSGGMLRAAFDVAVKRSVCNGYIRIPPFDVYRIESKEGKAEERAERIESQLDSLMWATYHVLNIVREINRNDYKVDVFKSLLHKQVKEELKNWYATNQPKFSGDTATVHTDWVDSFCLWYAEYIQKGI